MNTLSHGLSWIDLEFLGRSNIIAAAIVQGPGGVAIVDPGPTTCLATLEQALQAHGIRWDDVRHLMLTHIHLDHAGATGTLVREHPHITVLVHERGAKHMIDPSRLLDSATRLYGADMDRLWGEFAAVPPTKIVALSGGERIDAGGRTFDVAYTPGHASHHVSYFDPSSGVAFVGDVAGVCASEGYVLPPTPPPDIDLELWEESLQIFDRWRPSSLVLTHFGVVDDPVEHLRQFRGVLSRQAAVVRATLEHEDLTDEDRIRQFSEEMRADARRVLSEEDAKATEAAAAFDQLWLGLARYWRKKLAPTSPTR